MRALRIVSSCLLLIPLLVNFGCGNSAYVQKGPAKYTNTVKISGCKADPDTALVHKGDTLTWNIDPPDGHTYSVKFPKGKPFSSSTIPPGKAQNVTGDFWCNTLGGISSGLWRPWLRPHPEQQHEVSRSGGYFLALRQEGADFGVIFQMIRKIRRVAKRRSRIAARPRPCSKSPVFCLYVRSDC